MKKFIKRIFRHFFKEEIYTKKFWRKVLLEYKPEKFYICHSSITFRKAWDQKRADIKALAKEFLTEYYNHSKDYSWFYVSIYGGTLFEGYLHEDICKQARIDFILWCINKFN